MEHRAGTERLSTMILEVIAEQDDIDPIDVSPKLYTVIDTDALESLFFCPPTGPLKVEFQYAGYQVTIHGDEIVQVTVE